MYLRHFNDKWHSQIPNYLGKLFLKYSYKNSNLPERRMSLAEIVIEAENFNTFFATGLFPKAF